MVNLTKCQNDWGILYIFHLFTLVIRSVMSSGKLNQWAKHEQFTFPNGKCCLYKKENSK